MKDISYFRETPKDSTLIFDGKVLHPTVTRSTSRTARPGCGNTAATGVPSRWYR